MTLLSGCDVSHWQGRIDWRQVKDSGVAFVFQKSTEGASYVDPTADPNRLGCEAVGLPIGFYHFFRPKIDAVQQAEHFCKVARGGQLPPVLDLEAPGFLAEISDKVALWVQTVERELDQTPMIYTTASWWRRWTIEDKTRRIVSQCPVWVAHYGVPAPMIPRGWQTWAFWQYSQSGRVPGIAGNVDLDLYQGDTLPTGAIQNPD